MAIDGYLALSATWSDTDTDGTTGRALDTFNASKNLAISDGTGANAAQVQWNDERALAGSSEDLDLSGVLKNRKGKTVAATKVKALVVMASASNAGNLTVRFNPTNGWTAVCTGDVVLHPGGFLAIGTPNANGYAVTAGTGDILRIMGAAGYAYTIGFLAEGTES